MNGRLLAALLVGFPLLAGVAVGFAHAESPAIPRVNISPVRVIEGNGGSTGFSAEVTVGGGFGSVEVEINAVPGTAGREDFVFEPVRLTLIPGAPPAVVSGAVVGDRVPEGDESFTLTATSASRFVASQGGRVDIVEDDRPVGMHIEGVTALEGNEGSLTVLARVRLEPASEFPVRVDYKTVDGTATARENDYVPASGTVAFAAGEVLQEIPLRLIADKVWERDEAFAVVLSNPFGAKLTADKAEIGIANDDPGAVATLADVRVPEGDRPTSLSLTINFDRAVTDSGKIHVVPRSGLARNGQDFTAEFQVLYPPPGATSIAFTMSILGDTIPECDEGFFIDYVAYYLGDETRKTARVWIINDDGAIPAGPCDDPFTPDPSEQPLPDAGVPLDSVDAADARTGVENQEVGAKRGEVRSEGIPPDHLDAGGVMPLPAPQHLVEDTGACSMGGATGLGPEWTVLALLLAIAARRRGRRSR